MELNKRVKSRKGNIYNVNLSSVNDVVGTITVKNQNGDQKYVGSFSKNRDNSENYLIKLVQDIILQIEEKYSCYDDVKSFENWDGVIS